MMKTAFKADILRLEIIFLTASAFFMAQYFVAMDVVWSSFAKGYACAALLTMIGLVYRWLGRDAGIAAACLTTAQLVVFSSFIALLNYIGLAAHRPLHDEFIAGFDNALGLDWLAYVTAIKSNSTIATLLTLAYESALPQLPIAIAILALSRKFERLDEFTLAFMLAAIMTVVIWIVFPTVGKLVALYADGAATLPLQLALSREEALQVFSLWRDGPGSVRADEIVGLIGAPSFHTVMALLTMRALWGLGWISFVAIAINVLTLLSIPADGGHHFFDVAAGAAVAMFAVFVAQNMLQARHWLNAPAFSFSIARRPCAAAGSFEAREPTQSQQTTI
jgi:membrane-associated phospholipid phosphatase